jgi:hypothetical protein
MKDKWKIPEVIEREYLRPIAEELVIPYYKQYGEERVWIEVEADSTREHPKDLIKINILDKNKKDVDQVIIEIDDLSEETLEKFESGEEEPTDFFPEDDEEGD